MTIEQMKIEQALARLVDNKDLSHLEMRSVMQAIMSGQCTDAQIGGFLVALRLKGESIDEICAAVEVMRELAEEVVVKDANAIDIVGTGGDGLHTFNVSTASAFVAAAAGAVVAKHGNRSVSSKSGSADLLEAGGAKIELTASQVAEVINRCGVGFMFAQMHHSAMRHAIGPRREMAIRTVFNLLGPMTNPAKVKRQVIGVYAKEWLLPLAQVLRKLGSIHVMLVHADDGMDEISVFTETNVVELKHGEITQYKINPNDFGLAISQEGALMESLQVDSAAASLAIVESIFAAKEKSAARNIVVINAAAAIYVAGIVDSLAGGVQTAKEVIDSGAVKKRFDAYVEATGSV